MPKRHPPIDSSHHPFKRSGALGPGPRRQKLAEAADWKCKKRRGGKKYEQICTYVGPDESMQGKKKRIIRKPKAKARYNKLYSRWLEDHGPRFAAKARSGYRVRNRRS
jgi:hypothetical protein